MTVVLILLIKLSIAALIFGIGMGAAFADAAYLWRRAGLLLRSLLAMYVLVPLVAWLVVSIVPAMPTVKAALLVLAVSAGAPLLPRKLGGIGHGACIFSLAVTSSLLAVVMVPAWVALFAWHFGVTVPLPPLEVARIVGTALLLPLLAGMVFHMAAPALSDHVARWLVPIASAALGLAAAAILALNWNIVFAMRAPGLLALVLVIVAAMAIGHCLGGPDPHDRTTLAIACATRHLGIALVVAGMFRGPGTLVLVAAYAIVSALITVPYLRWRRGRTGRARQWGSRADGRPCHQRHYSPRHRLFQRGGRRGVGIWPAQAGCGISSVKRTGKQRPCLPMICVWEGFHEDREAVLPGPAGGCRLGRQGAGGW